MNLDISTENTVGKNNSGTVLQAGRNINIGYTPEQHEAVLRERLQELRHDLERAHGAEKQVLQMQMAALQQELANRETSYQEALNTIKSLNARLDRVSGDEATEERIEQARRALQQGSLVLAKELFAEIAQKEQAAIQRAAEAEFALGDIAATEIRWYDAAKHYERAAQLEPSVDHLLVASNYLNKTAQYPKAESLARQALEQSITQHGEEHPDTATSYNNVASNLDDQGKHAEAEPLAKRAVEIALKTLYADHPHTKIFQQVYDHIRAKIAEQ